MPLLLPIGQLDAGPRRRALAPVTGGIALACVLVFVGPQDVGQAAWAETYALTPARFFGADGGWSRAFAPIASHFAHAGWPHLVFNLVALVVFGSAVERRLGGRRFAALFFGLGTLALVAEAALHPDSTVPIVGASGAIAAVAGAFAVAFPRSRVLVAALFLTLPVRAWLAVGLWLAVELVAWTLASASSTSAHAAHVVGFLLGVAVMGLTVRYSQNLPTDRREAEIPSLRIS